MNKSIIVFGATGNTGLEICKKLKEHQLDATAFVRENSENKLKGVNIDIVVGNILKPEDVVNALNKKVYKDIVISLGSRDLKGIPVRSEGTQNIVNALKETHSKCAIHAISAHGVKDSWNRLNWFEKLISNVLIKKTMKDHELQENIIEAYTQDHHIVRPVALKDESGSGKIYTQKEGKLPNASIAREDVAEYIVSGIIHNQRGTNSICKA